MSKKVLLVDDEEDIRYFMSLLLSEWGFEVIQAGDGVSAYARFMEVMPSIVLTDIKMPGMDGIELLKRIKGYAEDTEVIMISGHGDMNLAIESLKYEAADFITKPIDETLLRHAVKKAEEKVALKAQVKAHTADLEHLIKQKTASIIELERQISASQVLDRLSSAMKSIVSTIGWSQYSSDIPCFVSLLNNRKEIISSNELYLERFGDRRGAPSAGIYKGGERFLQGSDDKVASSGEHGRSMVSRIAMAANGAELPVLVQEIPISGMDGSVELIIEIAVDITGAERLREALQWTQWKYQRLFNESPCYVTVQDKNLCITEANERFKQDFEYEETPTCFSSYKQRAEPCTDCPVIRTFEDGKNHQAESVVTTKKGEQRNILVWTAPLFSQSGEITHVMEMATDITQLRQLQDHITSLGIMLGSMSHGIKGLLTAMDGGIYRLNRGFDLQDLSEARKGWETIRLRIERIQKMVQDILYYTKPRKLELTVFSLRTFCDELVALFAEKAQKASIAFMTNFEGVNGLLEADRVAFASAMVNFLENAFDACEMDRTKKDHRVSFTTQADNLKAVFEVSDNGIGMDTETKNKMFSLFFSSKGSRGTGIGLFVSHHVIRQHHGKVEVDSQYGKGTRIRIEMPITRPEAQKHGVFALEAAL